MDTSQTGDGIVDALGWALDLLHKKGGPDCCLSHDMAALVIDCMKCDEDGKPALEFRAGSAAALYQSISINH